MRPSFSTPLLSLIALAILPLSCKEQKKQADTTQSASVSVIGSEVEYTSDSKTLKGYIAYDQNLEGKRPGVLVVHEWWGHNDYTRERADMLAGLGYTALAVDMYGNGKVASHPEDAGKFAMEVMSNFESGKDRFRAAWEELRKHPTVDPENIAAIGYCFGGSVVLSMANSGMDLDGVAAYHAGLGLAVMPGEGMRVKKILVCHGADDPFVSEESITAFKNAMAQTEVPLEFQSYPGAVHGFTSKGADSLGAKFNLPLAYNQEADSLSWAATKRLFDEVFDR